MAKSFVAKALAAAIKANRKKVKAAVVRVPVAVTRKAKAAVARKKVKVLAAKVPAALTRKAKAAVARKKVKAAAVRRRSKVIAVDVAVEGATSK